MLSSFTTFKIFTMRILLSLLPSHHLRLQRHLLPNKWRTSRTYRSTCCCRIHPNLFAGYDPKPIITTTMADSTSEQQDRPSKRLRGSGNVASVGQTAHNVELDGYGKHVAPAIASIPIPIKTTHAYGEIKRSLWYNVSFCDVGTCGYALPYQLLQFWLGIDEQENNTLKQFNLLSIAAYGITWHEFSLSIYNQATTRKWLLTQGSTTFETIDFETSQNLMILTDMNQTHTPAVIWPDEFMAPRSQKCNQWPSIWRQLLQDRGVGNRPY